MSVYLGKFVGAFDDIDTADGALDDIDISEISVPRRRQRIERGSKVPWSPRGEEEGV